MKAAKNEKTDDEVATVAAVERALRILRAFQIGDKSLSLAELGKRTGLYKSTVLRLAYTLETFGYLARTSAGAYQVGPSSLYLGMLFQQALDPADLITPVLQDVVQATGESASYYVEQGGKRVCIYRVTSPHTVRYHIVPGMTMPFDRGAGGKMMLAFRRPYQPQFSAIRRKLVAHSIQEVGSDSAAISCPVFGMDGDLAGVISLTGPYTRFNREAQRRSTPILLAAARKCTLGLGGRWPTETQSLDDGTFGQLQVGGRK